MKGVEMVSGMIRWLGMNLRASGLGVFSVWIKIVRAPLGRPRKNVFRGVDRASGRAVDDRLGSRDAVERARDVLGAAVARGSARRATKRSVCPFEAIVYLVFPQRTLKPRKRVVYREIRKRCRRSRMLKRGKCASVTDGDTTFLPSKLAPEQRD